MSDFRKGLPWLQHLAAEPVNAEEWLAEAERFIAEHPVESSGLNLLTLIAALYLRGLASAPIPDMALDAEASAFALPGAFADFLAQQGLEDEE